MLLIKLAKTIATPLTHSYGIMPLMNNTLQYCFSKGSQLQKMSKNQQDINNFIPNIDRPHDKTGGIYSVQRTMPKEEVSQELKERLQQLRKKHQLIRRELSKKVQLPFSLCGINRKTYHQSFSYMPQRIMNYYRIHHTTITDYLLKIYKASLYSIVDQNLSFMQEYWEEGFQNEVLKAIQNTKEKGYQIKITEEKKFIEEMKEQCKIVDAVLLRGLSVNRTDNMPPNQYHKYAEDDQFGLITYTPLYLTADNQKFTNPESNKNVYKGYQKMVLRTLLLIKTPLRLTIPELPVPPQLNTYEHLVVMQNQMIAPPHMQSRYKLQTLVQWLGKYRFGPWKVVDIDNFMRGNSPFRLHQPQQQLEQIFQNTIMDKSYYANIRKF